MRTIPLGEGMLSALKDWRSRTKYPGKDDPVFPDLDGGYQDHRGMVKWKFDPLFRKLQRKWTEEQRNEPVEVFNSHALRHFAISCWIEAGLPPKTIQTFAEHSSLQVMDRYGHLFLSDDHGRAMDAILRAACAGRATNRPERNARWPFAAIACGQMRALRSCCSLRGIPAGPRGA
jgi:integrase